jgi:hypothetical protein
MCRQWPKRCTREEIPLECRGKCSNFITRRAPAERPPSPAPMTTTSVPCDLLPFVLISGRTSSPSSPPSCILRSLADFAPRLERGMPSLGLRLCTLLPWPGRATGSTEGMENPDVSHAMQAATAHTIVRISEAEIRCRDQMHKDAVGGICVPPASPRHLRMTAL